jgi:hypothetical protein
MSIPGLRDLLLNYHGREEMNGWGEVKKGAGCSMKIGLTNNRAILVVVVIVIYLGCG